MLQSQAEIDEQIAANETLTNSGPDEHNTAVLQLDKDIEDTEDIEYDDEGNVMTQVKDNELSQLFGQSEEASEVDAEGTPKDGVFPYQFYTAEKAPGKKKGWGVAPGTDYISLKAKNNLYLVADGSWANANRKHPGPWEKFKPKLLGGNKVAL